MDWLAAGCTGVYHIESISRTGLKDLQAVETIECNDVHTALEAWDWGFDADRTCLDSQQAMARFIIDDTTASIRSYFEDDAKWRLKVSHS